MAPNNTTYVLNETDVDVDTKNVVVQEPKSRKYEYVWGSIIYLIYIHLAGVYAIYLIFTSAKLLTTIQAFIVAIMAALGSTCGAHRLWSHRSYKAKTPLKIILLFMQTLGMQRSAIKWAMDHRVHHKFCETDADPHNSNRGYFFSHMGWLLVKKHPEVIEKGSKIDLTDLTSDPLVYFQYKYYLHLVIPISFVLPTVVPMCFWNETFVNAWVLNCLAFCMSLNAICLINSSAHLYGYKPYDKYINPRENLSVGVLAMGEGWHNYHHTFPWDYKASELGEYLTNWSTAFIDLFAKIGWAYDLKTVSQDMVRRRVKKTGDGTHPVWGWNDKDMSEEDIRDAVVKNKKE